MFQKCYTDDMPDKIEIVKVTLPNGEHIEIETICDGASFSVLYPMSTMPQYVKSIVSAIQRDLAAQMRAEAKKQKSA